MWWVGGGGGDVLVVEVGCWGVGLVVREGEGEAETGGFGGGGGLLLGWVGLLEGVWWVFSWVMHSL